MKDFPGIDGLTPDLHGSSLRSMRKRSNPGHDLVMVEEGLRDNHVTGVVASHVRIIEEELVSGEDARLVLVPRRNDLDGRFAPRYVEKYARGCECGVPLSVEQCNYGFAHICNYW